MALAFLVAQRSPDPNTKHGSVIVNKESRILGTGYNGHPRGGLDDSMYDWNSDKKYQHVFHSELNSILNCVEPPLGASIYITGKPCSSCALAIIQSGIRKVVYGPVTCRMDINWALTEKMFYNHSVLYTEHKPGTTGGVNSVLDTLHNAANSYLRYLK